MKTYTIQNASLMEAIIKKSQVCFVGLSDEEGMPYVLPMNFGYNDDIIYLHSALEGHSIEIIKKNPKTCITFCSNAQLAYQNQEVACSYRMKSESVMCWGEVIFVNDLDEKKAALDIIMRQYSEQEFAYSLPALKNTQVWMVKVVKMTGKVFGEKHNMSF